MVPYMEGLGNRDTLPTPDSSTSLDLSTPISTIIITH